MAGNSFRGSVKRLGADGGKRAVLSTERITTKIRGALLSKGGPLSKGDEPGTPRGVPITGKGEAWMSDNQLKGKVLTKYQ